MGARSILLSAVAAACLSTTPAWAIQDAPGAPPAAVSDADREALDRLEAEAVALTEAGRFAEADALLEDLLRIELRVYGPDHPLTANTHAYRAGLAEAMGDLALAESRRRQEVSVRERLDDAESLGAARLALGALLVNQGRVEAALPFLVPAHDAFTVLLPPDDERRVSAALTLGRALFGAERHDEALAVLEPAARAVSDPVSALTPRAAYEYGFILNEAGRPGEAEPWLRRACELWRTPAPGVIAWPGEACLVLADVLVGLDRSPEAEPFFETALADAALAPDRRMHGAEQLIRLRGAAGRPVDPELLRLALEATEQAHGETSLFTAYAANRLGLRLGGVDAHRDEGLALLERAHALYAELTPQGVGVLVSARNIALALSGMGRYDEAAVFSRDVLAAFPDEGLSGPDVRRAHRRLALNLGVALMATDRLDEARAVLGDTRGRAEADGADAGEMVLIHTALADVATRTLDWPGIVEHRRLRLEHQRRLDDPYRLAQASAYYGQALGQTGEDRAAYEHLEQALALYDGLAETRESDRLYAMGYLGQAARRLGRLDEAERLHLAVLDARRRDPSAIRPLALAINDLAEVRIEQNRFAEAEAAYLEAMAMLQAAGEDESASHTLGALGQLWRFMGRMDEAETALRGVVDYTSGRYGADSPLNATPLRNLAVHLDSTGRKERALDVLLQVQALEQPVLEPDDPGLLNTRVRIGRVLNDLGRLDEAEAIFAEVLDLAMARLGGAAALTQEAASQLGFVVAQQGRYAEAAVLLTHAAELTEAAFGPDSRQMINVLQLLSYALYMDRRYDETIVVMNRVVRLADSQGARWPGTIVDAKSNLGRTYIEAGRPAEALGPLREAATTAARLSRERAVAISARAEVSRAPFRALVQAAWTVADAR